MYFSRHLIAFNGIFNVPNGVLSLATFIMAVSIWLQYKKILLHHLIVLEDFIMSMMEKVSLKRFITNISCSIDLKSGLYDR